MVTRAQPAADTGDHDQSGGLDAGEDVGADLAAEPTDVGEHPVRVTVRRAAGHDDDVRRLGPAEGGGSGEQRVADVTPDDGVDHE